eukprot:Skav226363  [mRNA]  locus=scaffold290:41300:46171:- [translate_table: standard]
MHEDTWHVEQFCGGYGGWQFALRFLEEYGEIPWKTIALDNTLEAVVQFGLNHRFQILGDNRFLDGEFLHKFPTSTVVQTLIKDVNWQKAIQWIGLELWTMSSPCVSWSFAGSQKGFHTQDGMSLAEGLGQCRIFQPPLLLIEQVSGFPKHPQFGIFLRLLEWAGYEILVADTLDQCSLTPPRRARWLSLCVRKGTTVPEIPQFAWPTGSQGAYQFDALQTLSAADLPEFQPTVLVASKYFNPANMPGDVKNLPKSTIMKYRLPDLWGPLPTFMAKYGDQHNLPDEAIASKGLFGFFARQGGTFRFFTPVEECLLHGQVGPIMLLKPKQLSYHHLGNMISIVHATALLLPALQLLEHISSEVTFSEVCRKLLEERLKISTHDIKEDEFAWYVGTSSQCDAMMTHQRFYLAQLSWKVSQHNLWPDGCLFHPMEGLIQVNQRDATSTVAPTATPAPLIDDRLTFAFSLWLVPGEYGTFHCQADLKWCDFLQQWEFRIFPEDVPMTPPTIDVKIHDSTLEIKQFLIPTAPKCLEAWHSRGINPKNLVWVRDLNDLTLYETYEDQTWKSFCSNKSIPSTQFFDCVGPIADNDPTWLGELHTQWIPVEQVPDIFQVMLHSFAVKIDTSVPLNTDILVLDCQGPEASEWMFLKLFADSQMQAWLATKGRQVNHVSIASGHWRLVLRPKLPKASTPVVSLRMELFMRLLQVILHSCSFGEGTQVVHLQLEDRMHRQQKWVGQYALHPNCSSHYVAMVTEFLSQLVPRAHVSLHPLQTDVSDNQVTSLNLVLRSPSELPTFAAALPLPNPLFAALEHVESFVIHDDIQHHVRIAIQASAEVLNHCKEVWDSPAIHTFLQARGLHSKCEVDQDRFLVELPNMSPTHPQFRETCVQLYSQLVSRSFKLLFPTGESGFPIKMLDNMILQRHATDKLFHPVFSVLSLWFHWIMPNRVGGMEPRLVFRGKQIMPESPTADVMHALTNHPGLKVHLIAPLRGGGPQKPPQSKQDYHKLVESGIASMLLDYQVQLPQIPPAVAKLIQHVSVPKLHALLQHDNSYQKHQQFQELCRKYEVQLPTTEPRNMKVQGKFQKIRDQQTQRQMTNPDPQQFQLKPGFFKNADGTDATILHQFSMQASGVLLAKPADVHQWLKATPHKATDELGVYILGHVTIPQEFSVLQVNAPATDAAGRELLLNGLLVQFGSKHLTTAAAQHAEYATETRQVASVTVWKADVEPSVWTQIVQAPVRTIQQMLTQEGFGNLLSQPWGRVFQHNGTTVKPEVATSVQFHCTFVQDTKFASLLRRSGFCRVYICPKTEAGSPDPKWKVVWVSNEMSILELEGQASGIAGAAGLVKSRRGFGLRIEAENYQAAWSKLKPNQPLPDMQETKWTFKLHPLPMGVTADTLKEWAQKSYQWRIKPIRSIGAKQWIIGADSIPQQILLFNTQPLLLQQLPVRGTKPAPAIAAGPKNLSVKPLPQNQEAQASAYRTGDPHQTQGRAAASSLPPVELNRSSEQRTLQGPVAQRMEQQESRLHAIETAMQTLKEDQQVTRQKGEEFQVKIETQLQHHVQHTQKGFDYLSTENRSLQQSVADAIANQECKMLQCFEEVKSLFLTTRGMKRTDPEPADPEELANFNE